LIPESQGRICEEKKRINKIDKMRIIKKALDPNYILGVGNVFKKETLQ